MCQDIRAASKQRNLTIKIMIGLYGCLRVTIIYMRRGNSSARQEGAPSKLLKIVRYKRITST